ncbi:MAG: hypothetical protein Q9209_007191, partial [Squamulea sp. 1 TL-2023]
VPEDVAHAYCFTSRMASTRDPFDDPTTASLRSRASSIVTTTTKFSLETLSQDDRSSIGAMRIRNHRLGPNAGRPNSITSISNPAPPYTEAAVGPTLQLPTHQNGDFQSLLSRLAEVADRPSEAASINEPLAPSTIASTGNTTPAPDSPLDPGVNLQAQIAHYSNVVRTLDSNYTAELERLRQKHAQELAVTRHDIDAAYRAQRKVELREMERFKEEAAAARDLEIKQIRAERDATVLGLEGKIRGLEEKVQEMERALAAGVEEGVEERRVAVEKARHEVEDLWERRWRDRARVEGEERERAEAEREEKLKVAVAEKVEETRRDFDRG